MKSISFTQWSKIYCATSRVCLWSFAKEEETHEFLSSFEAVSKVDRRRRLLKSCAAKRLNYRDEIKAPYIATENTKKIFGEIYSVYCSTSVFITRSSLVNSQINCTRFLLASLRVTPWTLVYLTLPNNLHYKFSPQKYVNNRKRATLDVSIRRVKYDATNVISLQYYPSR